jgi:hypothetical protein
MSLKIASDWLPNKANLSIQGIITPKDYSCVFGCSGIESAQHYLPLIAFLTFFSWWFGPGLNSR